ncbi:MULTISPECIES: hypothetical protein [unclassified Leptospira]|uniref:hypothetical protein n=1 Tax=unclassified Leptospira TaxID=2633828 RepID=UPI00051929CE|nr:MULTISPECIES: hypothetical protein [unclassified Leptospira]
MDLFFEYWKELITLIGASILSALISLLRRKIKIKPFDSISNQSSLDPFTQELGHEIRFISILRPQPQHQFLQNLSLKINEIRCAYPGPKKLTLNLSDVEYMNADAISAFTKVILDVAANNGIYLQVILNSSMKTISRDFISLSEQARHENINIKIVNESQGHL